MSSLTMAKSWINKKPSGHTGAIGKGIETILRSFEAQKEAILFTQKNVIPLFVFSAFFVL